jgi:hypothetical protein
MSCRDVHTQSGPRERPTPIASVERGALVSEVRADRRALLASRTRLRISRRSAITFPAAPPKSPAGTAQIDHAIVDEHELIYANDRFTGGLYILRYTGSVPLNRECRRDALGFAGTFVVNGA